MKKRILTLLLKSLDVQLEEKERSELENRLKYESKLQTEKKQLENIRKIIRMTSDMQFQSDFAERILAKLNYVRTDEAESFFNALKGSFKPIAVAAVIVIFGLFSYDIILRENSSSPGIPGQKSQEIEEALDPAWTYLSE